MTPRYEWTPASEPPGIAQYIRICQCVRIKLAIARIWRVYRDIAQDVK